MYFLSYPCLIKKTEGYKTSSFENPIGRFMHEACLAVYTLSNKEIFFYSVLSYLLNYDSQRTRIFYPHWSVNNQTFFKFVQQINL